MAVKQKILIVDLSLIHICSIKRARKVNEGEYDPADYLPVSDKAVSYTHLKDFFNLLLLLYEKLLELVIQIDDSHRLDKKGRAGR